MVQREGVWGRGGSQFRPIGPAARNSARSDPISHRGFWGSKRDQKLTHLCCSFWVPFFEPVGDPFVISWVPKLLQVRSKTALGTQ